MCNSSEVLIVGLAFKISITLRNLMQECKRLALWRMVKSWGTPPIVQRYLQKAFLGKADLEDLH
jgi:hypothetical protein